MHLDVPPTPGPGRMSFYHRLTNPVMTLPTHRLSRKASSATNAGNRSPSRSSSPPSRDHSMTRQNTHVNTQPPSPSLVRRISQVPRPESYSPLMESVNHGVKSAGMQTLQLPDHMTQDDFTRAVTVATVSALRHQAFSHSPGKLRGHPTGEGHEEGGGHGGHEGPSWSRLTSAVVLLSCTALYAAIAGKPLLSVPQFWSLNMSQKSWSMLSTWYCKAPE